MIRFLMDENIPPPVVDFLRKRGFDAKEIGKTGTRGASDDEIMQQALQEGRVLLTFDKHFSNILLYPFAVRRDSNPHSSTPAFGYHSSSRSLFTEV
jgi:predicted nuclease of predicted toxin-antitoxin system